MDDLIHRFTFGDCHILAKEIHKQTKGEWELGVVGDKEYWKHAFVYKDGKALDIEGLHGNFNKFIKKWGGTMFSTEEQDLHEHFKPNYSEEVFDDSKKIAKKEAKRLIKEHT